MNLFEFDLTKDKIIKFLGIRMRICYLSNVNCSKSTLFEDNYIYNIIIDRSNILRRVKFSQY